MKKVTTAVPNAVREGIRRHRGTLALPQVSVAGTAVATSLRRVYANAHAYHVNSVDPNSDGEHFISADDLRINMWNLEITDRSFSEFPHPQQLSGFGDERITHDEALWVASHNFGPHKHNTTSEQTVCAKRRGACSWLIDLVQRSSIYVHYVDIIYI